MKKILGACLLINLLTLQVAQATALQDLAETEQLRRDVALIKRSQFVKKIPFMRRLGTYTAAAGFVVTIPSVVSQVAHAAIAAAHAHTLKEGVYEAMTGYAFEEKLIRLLTHVKPSDRSVVFLQKISIVGGAALILGLTIRAMYPPPKLEIDETETNVGSSRVDLQACKLEYSIVSPK